jgi:hypothetical protein
MVLSPVIVHSVAYFAQLIQHVLQDGCTAMSSVRGHEATLVANHLCSVNVCCQHKKATFINFLLVAGVDESLPSRYRALSLGRIVRWGRMRLGRGFLVGHAGKKVFSAKQGVFKNLCALHLRAEVYRPAPRPPKLAQSPHSKTLGMPAPELCLYPHIPQQSQRESHAFLLP